MFGLDNAIVERPLDDMPKDKWVELTLTYDGSSKADGVKLYCEGTELLTEAINDNLYQDIIFNVNQNPADPGLEIGAIWRGKGIGVEKSR